MNDKNGISIPGTIIRFASAGYLTGGLLGGGIFSLIGAGVGLFLSQITGIAEGLTNETVQNWVKRGLIEKPNGKTYNEDQVARILIINSLRNILELNEIKFLLEYVNGNLKDKSDDIVSEKVLLDYYSVAVTNAYDINSLEAHDYSKIINEVLKEYRERKTGDKYRLQNALTAMIMAYKASQIKKKTEEFIVTIKD